jgi:DNA-binding NarL/FixJ family response regulator
MNELDGLSALIIEPHAGMRASIHNMLNLCGLTKIDHAQGSNAAIKHLGLKTFDIILCEYDLDGGQDGQQLLEDLRHHKLISLATMFFMVTAEGNYGKVVSAAELAPTDYILKPFTADRLLERIARALDKRNVFMPVYQFMEVGDQRSAIAACIEGVKNHPRYAVDFMRLRAELHMFLGEPAEAEPIYQQLYEAKAIAWARLGLAKTLFMRERFPEAQSILEGLVESNKKFVDAYDWLAKTHTAMGEMEKTQTVLAEAVSVSPHAVRRLRKSSAKPSIRNFATRKTMSSWSRRSSRRATRCRPPPSSATSTSRWAGKRTRPCAAPFLRPWCTNTRAMKRAWQNRSARRWLPARIAWACRPKRRWNWPATACKTIWKRGRPT